MDMATTMSVDDNDDDDDDDDDDGDDDDSGDDVDDDVITVLALHIYHTFIQWYDEVQS